MSEPVTGDAREAIEYIIEDGVRHYWADRGREKPDRPTSAGQAVIAALSESGYRIVRATPDDGGAVTVPLDDIRAVLDAMVYVQDTYFWEKWKYQEPYDRLTAIAAGQEADDDAD